jgi:hypothetical protein
MNIMDGLKKALSRRDFMKTTAAGIGITALSELRALGAGPVQEPIVIHRAPIGEAVRCFVLWVGKGESLSYLTYIAGYDGPYFSDPTIHNETTAYFTARATAGGVQGKLFRVGNLTSREAGVAGGFTTVYFNPTPHGNYADPSTFSDGIEISAVEYQHGTDMILKYVPGASIYDSGTLHMIAERKFAGSFEIGDKTYTCGKVGDRMVGYTVFSLNPTDPSVTNSLSHYTASGPAL